MPDYRNLRAWQLARDVAVQSRPWIKKLPPEERDALADQWRRDRGSLHEVAVVLDLVVALEYFKESDLVPLQRVRDECARTLWGLLRSIAARSSSSS